MLRQAFSICYERMSDNATEPERHLREGQPRAGQIPGLCRDTVISTKNDSNGSKITV